MINYFFYFFLIFFIFCTIYLANRYSFLRNLTGLNHQNLFENQFSTPLIGGFYLFLFLIFHKDNFSLFNFIFFSIFFFIGLVSDTKFEFNPKLRFFVQFLIALCFVYFSELFITDVRINFLNDMLSNQAFSIIFTAFCIIVVLNGSNFIDGNNTLLIGYYLFISFSLYIFNPDLFEVSYYEFLKNIFLFLTILFVFNFFEKFYMGDSGAYLLSVVFSLLLIKIFNNNPGISPYYIANLLWYPAFENLFSILRKFCTRENPLIADNKHLHQLLFLYLKSKITIKVSLINSLTSNVINIYNLIVFLIVSNFIYNTSIQICFIIINIITYVFAYYFLMKKQGA